MSSLPVPALTEPQEEILIEVGEVSPSGATCSEFRAPGTGLRRDCPIRNHGGALGSIASGTRMVGTFWLPLVHWYS